MKAQTVTLPNGMTVYSPRKEEALLMYGEVGDYVKHHLQLKAGAVVFDVGANIGMFSLWAYEHCQGDLQVYAFEPLAPTFALLEANLRHIDEQRLHAFCYGLSKQAGTAQFAYYPNATFASTAYPDTPATERKLTQTLLTRSYDQLPAPLSAIRYLPSPLRQVAVNVIARVINQRQTLTCELKTLSQVIREQAITRIDFLKIDAEKSELDVLQGIETEHWGMIQQLFIEIHDRDGRIEAVQALLSQHGFGHIIIEQEAFFHGTDIHAIYASR